MAKRGTFGSIPTDAHRRSLEGLAKREALIQARRIKSLQAAGRGNREAASTFQVNDVVVIEGDEKKGDGRVIEVNEKTGQLTILFGNKRQLTYAPTFVRKVHDT